MGVAGALGRRRGREVSVGVARARSVHPVDRDPLWLGAQLLHGGQQGLEGVVQVIVSDGEVEVVSVRTPDTTALIHRLLQVCLLGNEGKRAGQIGAAHIHSADANAFF